MSNPATESVEAKGTQRDTHNTRSMVDSFQRLYDHTQTIDPVPCVLVTNSNQSTIAIDSPRASTTRSGPLLVSRTGDEGFNLTLS